ncbi:hypothetical protein MHU86_6157 [Fragilaria crotonensis]|nr:hypothetical protein MHU86_6157 [Fragilaria crotonensis]
MDFKTDVLFGSDTQTLVNRTTRELSSRHHKQVTAYIRRKHELLTKCNAFERSDRLQTPGDRHAFAERLDRDILDASLNAEKDLPKVFEPAWSVALAQARKKKLVLTKQLTALKTGLNHHEILRKDARSLDNPSNSLKQFRHARVQCEPWIRKSKNWWRRARKDEIKNSNRSFTTWSNQWIRLIGKRQFRYDG